MSVLFNDSNNIKGGYFGKLELFDTQADFSEVFGDKPTIISPNTTTSKYTISTARSLYPFGEKFKLDLFLHMCRKYYFGHDSVEKSLIVQDMCHQISEVKKKWKEKNRILMRGSPDKIFDKFFIYREGSLIVRTHGLYNCVHHTSRT